MFGKILRQNFTGIRRFSQLGEHEVKQNMGVNYSKVLDNYMSMQDDLKTYQKKLIYRSGMLGMKELDLACGKWAKRHMFDLSREECERYEREILSMESPDLFFLLLESKIEVYEDFPKGHYLHVMKEFLEGKDWFHS